APTATAVISAITTDGGTSSTDFITNDQTLIVTAVMTGTLGSGETVQISLDNGSTWNTATLVSGSTYSFDNTANTLVAGSYNVRARVVDTAGNAGTVSAPTVVTIDTSGPAVTATLLVTIDNDTSAAIVQGTGSTTDSAINTDRITRAPFKTVSGVYFGTLIAGSEVIQISSDGGTTWNTATSIDTTAKTWSYTEPTAKTTTSTYLVRAMDTAGNVAGSSTRVVTIDTTAPSIATLLAPVLPLAFDTGVVGDNITVATASNIPFSNVTHGLAEANSTIALVNDVDNDGIYSQGIDNIISATNASATGTWSTNMSAATIGSYHLAFMVVDAAGNRSLLTPTTHLRV
ncbi:Ig-like domain-containing protein, partial [Pseudomonas zeae]|uniref:Ig-like domain-containing protein n=1 Tax=Pseudomonas zeae TaxID=2745510 RepID=UPI0039DF3CA5